MTSKPPINPTVAPTISGGYSLAVTTAGQSPFPPSRTIGQRAFQLRLFNYAYNPEHPALWHSVTTRDLEEAELFEVQGWLRLMTSGKYDTITHYTPAMRLCVYCERSQDAAMFKLAWGGQ